VTESIAAAVFLIDPDGRLVWSNPRGLEITGYDEAERRGRSPLSLFSPDGAAAPAGQHAASWPRRSPGKNHAAGLPARLG
jgi:PAS domain S-box-containing protein